MLLDQINLNQIRVFQSVYKTRSMTKAAEELHLTQSGISQHIKALEEILEVQLFDRIKQKLVPTTAGKHLYEKSVQNLNLLEQTLLEVTAHENELRGNIIIGVPAEFGFNLIVPKIVEFMSQYPEVRIDLRVDMAPALSEMIIRGELDFAFVDEFKLDGRIATQKVYDERLELCYSKKYLKKLPDEKSLNKKFFEGLSYISYQEDAPVLRMWFQQVLKIRKINLNVRARVADVTGIAQFVRNGIGVGVLPFHKVRKMREAGDAIEIFPYKSKPMFNSISLAYLAGRSQSPAVSNCQNWLSSELKSLRLSSED